MPATDPPAGGVLNSLRRICDTGLALVQNRAELFSLELEEQKARLLKTFLLAGILVFLANLAVLMVALTIIVAVGKDARVPVMIGFSVFFTIAALVTLFLLRREMRSTPPPFEQTVAELQQDRNWLTSEGRWTRGEERRADEAKARAP